ncbi:MAG: hypothetical protein IPO53_15350 [Chitinophagaceae bacterium]|nr:hypothetical protein [Chitinophagaceae bacterium]
MHERYDGMMGWSDKWIDVSFTDNIGTGTINYKSETIVEGKHLGRNACNGAGSVELWAVEIYRPDSTCTIETIGPVCDLGPDPWGVGHGNDIVILDKPWSGNPNLLSGNETVTARLPGDLGTVTTTYSWSLYRGPFDAQFIITPNAYNIWVPKATKDELQKGSVMDITLKVQGRNGGVSSLKAVSFELKLSNTSREPGTTLNMPLQPSANQLPDIRFIPHTIGESIDEDQNIEINSADGKTGTATLASYDGGGWTTLTAVAVLEGGFRIEGTLLTPTGIKEIPIPKRTPGSKIATTWLTANGNPGEMDDKELLQTKPGDGLTAYEEYRGVISEGNFLRLKATEKELGVMATRANHTLFAEGVRWFESATGIEVIRFDETEIGGDRRLNQNTTTGRDYKQYVLKRENGPTSRGAAGENRPTTLSYMIPKESELVVINVDWINTFYPLQEAAAQAAGLTMPYTKAELLASTVAHELAHGVNVNHHGEPSILPQNRIAYENSSPSYHIFGTNGREIPVQNWKFDAVLGKRYFEIKGYVGETGNEESGDLSCIMAYTSMYNWSYRTGADGSLNYYEVPLLPIGKKLCTSKTGINDINSRPNSKYFGAAAVGNCMSQIKLK